MIENYNDRGYGQQTITLTDSVSKVMRGVYLRMFLGLILTAVTAFLAASSKEFMITLISNRLLFWGLMIAELAVVLVLSARINKMSTGMAALLFFGYALLNGLVFSTLFLAFDLGSIAQTFLITAGVFGAMTVYGYFTKTDLSKMGSILIMALIGLTAWDTQKIKMMIAYDGGANTGKIATIGALSLYLDFINLFLYLLRFFGASRE